MLYIIDAALSRAMMWLSINEFHLKAFQWIYRHWLKDQHFMLKYVLLFLSVRSASSSIAGRTIASFFCSAQSCAGLLPILAKFKTVGVFGCGEQTKILAEM